MEKTLRLCCFLGEFTCSTRLQGKLHWSPAQSCSLRHRCFDQCQQAAQHIKCGRRSGVLVALIADIPNIHETVKWTSFQQKARQNEKKVVTLTSSNQTLEGDSNEIEKNICEVGDPTFQRRKLSFALETLWISVVSDMVLHVFRFLCFSFSKAYLLHLFADERKGHTALLQSLSLSWGRFSAQIKSLRCYADRQLGNTFGGTWEVWKSLCTRNVEILPGNPFVWIQKDIQGMATICTSWVLQSIPSASASKISSSAAWWQRKHWSAVVTTTSDIWRMSMSYRKWKKALVCVSCALITQSLQSESSSWAMSWCRGKHCTVSKFLETQPPSYTAAIFDGDVVVAAPKRSLDWQYQALLLFFVVHSCDSCDFLLFVFFPCSGFSLYVCLFASPLCILTFCNSSRTSGSTMVLTFNSTTAAA